MYAVLKTGGKQYKVAQNDVIIVEKLAAEAGTSIEIDEILMIDNDGVSTVGAPLIEGARVAADVLEQKRAKKITVFKKKRRQNYRRTIGHRQELTVLRITDILDAGESKKPKKVTPKVKETVKSETAPKAKAAPKAKEALKSKDSVTEE